MLPDDISMNFPSNISKLNSKIPIKFGEIVFWIIFSLIYLYLNRLLIIVTDDKFRLGVLVLGLSLFLIVLYQKVVKNYVLIFIVILLSAAILFSTMLNNIPLLKFLAFVRIPLLFYLIYNLVSLYLNSEKRVTKVFRILYIIAALQLPLIIFQRIIFPFLPEGVIFGSSLTDFGMGTFSGDTAMAFSLIGLVILLLFDQRVKNYVRHNWFLAGWLSLTILVSNSQIQHITILVVWSAYLISHLKLKTLLILSLLLVIATGLIIILSQASLMTYPLLQNTFIKFSAVSQIFSNNVDYDVFLSGGYDRSAAVSYYLNQPIKWLGDGPGTVYDTVTGKRTVGSFGHVFTYYAEVGLVGWLLSIMVFFVMAFPIYIEKSSAKIRVSWVGTLMFLAVMIVSIVKYPMGDTSLVFTYCVILVGYQCLSTSRTAIRLPSHKVSDFNSQSLSCVDT